VLEDEAVDIDESGISSSKLLKTLNKGKPFAPEAPECENCEAHNRVAIVPLCEKCTFGDDEEEVTDECFLLCLAEQAGYGGIEAGLSRESK
jgi:hypothetical protein